MSAVGAHKVTEAFEQELCKYTGAPFCACVDSCSSALELCLQHENVKGMDITIPNRTYMSVPAAIIMAGAHVKWRHLDRTHLSGAYRLAPTRIWDCALRFTANMYEPGMFMCISFTGAYKHLKLGKGGAILTDDEKAWRWFKRARNSGRNECSYHVDKFTMLGRNVYMMPQIAAQGLLLMNQFYELNGDKKSMPDLCLPYPDLSRFEIYNQ